MMKKPMTSITRATPIAICPMRVVRSGRIYSGDMMYMKSPIAIGVALVMEVIGFFIIHKIVDIKV